MNRTPISLFTIIFVMTVSSFSIAWSSNSRYADVGFPEANLVEDTLTFGSFEYIVTDGKVTISGFLDDITEVDIPSTIGGLPVTTIGDRAFRYSGLTSLTIPDSVTSIKFRAFSYCNSLIDVSLGNGVITIGDYAFSRCPKLTNMTIPDSVTSIGEGAFEFCTSLTNMIIPGSVTSIQAETFSLCTNLTGVSIGEGATSIGIGAFSDCSSLTTIIIPESVTSIGNSAFLRCDSLASIYFLGDPPSLGESYVFEGTHPDLVIYYLRGTPGWGVTYGGIPTAPFDPWSNSYEYSIVDGEVTITEFLCNVAIAVVPEIIEGAPVTSIAAEAFMDCTSLTSLTISDGITSIGASAFSGCTGLTSVIIPDSVTSLGDSAFSGCTSLASLTISSGLTRIGDSVFDGCTGLTSVIIPDSITSLGDSAFADCTSLTSLDIPVSVTDIGDWAFSGCSSLTNVTVSEEVTSIGNYAFSDCSDLIAVYFLGDPPSLGGVSVFNGTHADLVIYYISGNPQWGGLYGGQPTAPFNPWVDTFEYDIANGEVNISRFLCDRTEVEIPDLIDGLPVTSIGNRAFAACTSVSSVSVPDSVDYLGAEAFMDCSSLVNVYFLGDAPLLGDNDVFRRADPDLVIHYIAGTTGWGETFGGFPTEFFDPLAVSYEYTITNAKATITGFLCDVTVADIPATIGGFPVTVIAEGAFADCTQLTSVTIPDSVAVIANQAFQGCTGLSNITLPNAIISIGQQAFADCSSLTMVRIGEGLTSLGDYAFYSCSELTSVTFMGDPPSLGGNGVFNNAHPDLIVYYAIGTDGWGETFAGRPTAAFDPWGNSFGYSISGGEVTIVGFTCNGAEAYIPSTIQGLPVTAIADEAFADCTILSGISIPDSIISIGDRAFSGCTNLLDITIPDSVLVIGEQAFNSCSSLTRIDVSATNPNYASIDGVLFNESLTTLIQFPAGLTGSYTVPDGVTVLGDYAFFDCNKLASVIIPDSLTNVGSFSFSGCTNLNSVFFMGDQPALGSIVAFQGVHQDNVVYYMSGAFGWGVSFGGRPTSPINPLGNSYEYTIENFKVTITGFLCDKMEANIPNTIEGLPVTAIAYTAFLNCSSVVSVTIPNSVVSIGYAAFNHCTSLTTVNIPESVVSIGESPFFECASLTSINVDEDSADYASIDGVLFDASLTTLIQFPPALGGSYTIPNSVTTIGERAFSGCTNLTSLTMGDNVTTIRTEAFRNCSSLTTLNIGDGLKTIGGKAFSGCVSLTSVSIPESVVSIDYEAFQNCTSLSSLDIGNSVTSIGYEAFQGCNSLTTMTIPDSVTSIGNFAFSGCTGLTSAYFMGEPPILGGSNVFTEAHPDLVIYYIGGTPGWEDTFAGRSTEALFLTSGSYEYVITDGGISITTFLCDVTEADVPNTIDDVLVTSISDGAFSGCTSLTKVTIPESVSSIGASVFDGCTSLTRIDVADSNPSYSSIDGVLFDSLQTILVRVPEGFGDSLTIPASVTNIGGEAFNGCADLTSVYFLGDLPTLDGNAVFEGAHPDLVVYYVIGTPGWEDTFAGRSTASFVLTSGSYEYGIADGEIIITRFLCDVTEADVPDTIDGMAVTALGDGVFEGCESLTSVTIPESVTSIGESVFSSCTSLTAINISGGNPSYTSVDGVLFDASMTTLIRLPEGLAGYFTVSESVTSIGGKAFNGCADLTSVYFMGEPPTLEGDSVFEGAHPDLVVYYVIETPGWGETFAGVPTASFIPLGDSYEYSIADGEVTITKFLCNVTETYIPDSIEGLPVTSIGESAFSGCSDLTSVIIPDSVTAIGNLAFNECSGLIEVTIPDSVTSVGDSAFAGCTSLTDVTIPDSVTSVGDSAFAGCTSLTDITIPDSVTSVGDSAFDGCTSLTDVTIPDSVTSIGDSAFTGCTSLTNVTIPDSVTSIGESAFSGCSGLTSVDFGSGVTDIGELAFNECTNLASISIPNSVTNIGVRAFVGCTSLTSLEIPNSVSSIGDFAFSLCTGVTSLSIADGITDIGNYTFYGCSGLVSVDIPDSVETIGSWAFSRCTSLTNVNIPDSVSIIGEHAFDNCSALSSLSIPESVVSINDRAFSKCSSLTNIYFMGDPPETGIVVFEGAHPDLAVYYLIGTLGWGETFAGIPAIPYLPWGNYIAVELAEGLFVDTGDWLGLLEVSRRPWIWSPDSDVWFYMTEDVAEAGDGWILVLSAEEEAPGLWLYMMPGTSWGWSYGLSRWLYVSPEVLDAGFGWVYLL